MGLIRPAAASVAVPAPLTGEKANLENRDVPWHTRLISGRTAQAPHHLPNADLLQRGDCLLLGVAIFFSK